MRKYVLLLAGLCFLNASIAAAGQAAGAAKPPAQTAKPATDKPADKPAFNADKKEIKVPAKVLQTYAGEYELDGKTLTFKVDDKGILWGGPNPASPHQLYAETQTKFFLKTAPIQITFKADKGKVTGLLMQQGDGPERELTKVK